MIGVAKHTPFLAKFGAIRAVSHNTTSGLQINFYAGVTTGSQPAIPSLLTQGPGLISFFLNNSW